MNLTFNNTEENSTLSQATTNHLTAIFVISLLSELTGAIGNVFILIVAYKKYCLKPSNTEILIVLMICSFIVVKVLLLPISDGLTFSYVYGYQLPMSYCTFFNAPGNVYKPSIL